LLKNTCTILEHDIKKISEKQVKDIIMFLRYLIMLIITFISFMLFGCSSGNSSDPSLIADHSAARLSVLESIPDSALSEAESELIIAYGHTSHGSQIIDGINGLDAFMTGRGHAAGKYSGLVINDFYGSFGGSAADDLGAPDRTEWEAATRTYLNAHPEVNVIVWSWCGQVSSSAESDISDYLGLMNGLEQDYPGVKFVYMTGHLDGTGLTGNLHLRNEQIRKYCRDNDKLLFDFADIETYDPDGTYYGNFHPTDACDYDGGNWATEWQGSHTVNADWYSCSSEHSQPVNANMKAYAFWWLMARIAGWNE
jgi:hypothetical protein